MRERHREQKSFSGAAGERSNAVKSLHLVPDRPGHPSVRHHLPPRHQSFLHHRSPELRLRGAEQRGKMAVPPPGDITGEKEQSLGGRSQALVLCKPKRRRSGEIADAASHWLQQQRQLPALCVLIKAFLEAELGPLISARVVCGFGEHAANSPGCGRTVCYNRANPFLQHPHRAPTPLPPPAPAPPCKPSQGCPFANPPGPLPGTSAGFGPAVSKRRGFPKVQTSKKP